MMNISRQIFSAALGLLPVLTELLCFCVTSRQNILQLYLGSFLCYLTGFILWNLDNHTCPTLQYIRAALPTFLRPFIQVLLLYISDFFILTHSQVFLFFKYSSLFSVTKLKMICQQELPLKISHPWWMSRFFFLFTFVLTMGTSFIQFYRLAMFLFHPSICNSLLPPLPAARVVAPASWLRHLPQHPPRGASTPHTPQVNQPVQVHQCGQWISC